MALSTAAEAAPAPLSPMPAADLTSDDASSALPAPAVGDEGLSPEDATATFDLLTAMQKGVVRQLQKRVDGNASLALLISLAESTDWELVDVEATSMGSSPKVGG